ncbi:MAG: aromatic ring-hydroxylating dioxygenase subunit alpha [Proteobacteria bacterium]|nr:aromatic ring-hydroxylating dioxygenase subunit alpha [Pseudomonadota bacterium]
MKHADQVRLLEELMDKVVSGTNVNSGVTLKNPTKSYWCPELAEREWQTFFRSHPQIIGMSGDLPERGSFFTLDDFGAPILATRDAAGEFHAFVNSCRHRGAMVETREKGECQRFACPFHGWTYANSGELTAVTMTEQFGPLDKSEYGLLRLPAVEKYGFLWVHPDPRGTILPDELLGGLASEFESWQFGELVYGGRSTYAMPLNWKLANDTFGESYHFKRLHKDSLAAVFEGDVQCFDQFERNLRMALAYKSIVQLRDRRQENWRITDGAFLVYYLYPNIQVNVGATGVTLVRIYPDPKDPTNSISHISFYIRKELLLKDPETVKRRAQAFGDIVESEDYAVGVTTQKAIRSGMQEHLLFGHNEPGLQHFHNTFRDALGMPPLESV